MQNYKNMFHFINPTKMAHKYNLKNKKNANIKFTKIPLMKKHYVV